jgi:hypothetical protein
MAGKYTKQGVFPLILDGSHSTAGNETWGNNTEKVGLIKITGAHTFTFDGSYPGESGDTVVVANNTAAGVFVDITPDPLSDDTSDDILIGAGNYLTMMYHQDHGWIPLGATNAAQA